jgi:hypothetical protein
MLLQDFLVDYDFTGVHTINKKARKRIFICSWVAKLDPKRSLKNSSRRKRLGESIQDYLFDLLAIWFFGEYYQKKDPEG